MKAYLSFFLILIHISLFSQNKAEDPVAVDDTVTMMQYGTVHINVLANDYDPAGLAIFINEVDEEEGFEISFQDSIVTVTALDYYETNYRPYIKFDYRIENSAGERDRADIYVYIIENPEVPIPEKDFAELDCQTEVVINLVENDEYSGTEDLVIDTVIGGDIEIFEDQQRVKIKAGLYSGPFDFSYRVKENGGNEYSSKWMYNRYFVRNNKNAPIGVKDEYSINLGESKLFDVVENDISGSSLTIDTVGLPEYVNVVDNQLNVICPDSSYVDLEFAYYAIAEDGLSTRKTDVKINIQDVLKRPKAVDDIFEVEYNDTIVLDVLANDENYLNEPLILENGESFLKINQDPEHIHYGWQMMNYFCKNVNQEGKSNMGTVRYKVLPPQEIELPDVNLYYRIGDTLKFNYRDYNNLGDSNEYLFSGTYNSFGSTYVTDNILTYYCNWGDISTYYYANDSLYDAISVDYIYVLGNNKTVRFSQQFNVIYENKSEFNFLDVNNFTIPVSPFGTITNTMHLPRHKYIDADYYYDTNYGSSDNYLLMQIRPWLVNEYREGEDLKISADMFQSEVNDLFPGPITDSYDSEYNLKYFRTWSVTNEEIDSHQKYFDNPDYKMPEAIENWPAGPLEFNGHQFEQADFVDANQNQIYDPANGDYPKISGDKAILYVLNDNRFKMNGISYDSLNMDVYAMIYAFNRPESDLFHNTFFIKYKVVNKSEIDYDKFRFAQYVQSSQWMHKDYIACDTNLNTIYRYPSHQGNEQFTTSFTFLNRKMGKFTTMGDLDSYPYAKYGVMMGTYGDPFTYWQPPVWMDFAPLDYVYPGSVNDTDSWTNFSYWNGGFRFPPDNSVVTSTESMQFNSGETKYFEYAFSVNYHAEQDYFDFANMALDRAAQLIECYQKDSVPGGGSFTGLEEVSNNSNTELLVYPNPAKTILYVEGVSTESEYSIYTLQGQRIEGNRMDNEISIEHLSEGFYLLQIRSIDGKQEWTSKFVKQ